MVNNKGTTKSFLHDFSTEPMYSTNLSKTGDYTLGAARDRAAGTYNFTGGDTYTQEVFLEDGCYTFTIFDSYGDGQQDGTVVGGYTITCSILNVLEGGGAFGSSEAKEFCVNQ